MEKGFMSLCVMMEVGFINYHVVLKNKFWKSNSNGMVPAISAAFAAAESLAAVLVVLIVVVAVNPVAGAKVIVEIPPKFKEL